MRRLVQLMEWCWDDREEVRPSFREILLRLESHGSVHMPPLPVPSTGGKKGGKSRKGARGEGRARPPEEEGLDDSREGKVGAR